MSLGRTTSAEDVSERHVYDETAPAASNDTEPSYIS